ncbi:hypothetical protein QP924_09840 [Corynebacterium pseudodiphtheriticum]|uniref:hypothetical protein n=1 Tax=Corynebacterium pseudodiphtheriticum TaxID=37637 RepID=UPI0025502B55|nr:hypothetical protein [Corynebacterium pseudodiphtheriticum]MDK8701136.1 hypothetical protein [Corynebacterium pseudodiphtheriticum]
MSNSLKAFKEIKRYFDSLAEEGVPPEMEIDEVCQAMERHHGTKWEDTSEAVEFLRSNNIIDIYWEHGECWITPGTQWGVWDPK